MDSHFPKLKWYGEEDPTEAVDIPEGLAYPEVREDLLDELEVEGANEPIDYESLMLFIDPVDGTNEFTKARIESVTVLLGLSNQGKPQYGVVQSVRDWDLKQPVTRFGGQGMGVYRLLESGECSRLAPYKKEVKLVNALVSESMDQEKQKAVGCILNCEISAIGATGSRLVALIEHPETYQAYLQKRGPESEDECAGFALAL